MLNIALIIINLLFIMLFYKKFKAFSLMFFLVVFMQLWQFISCVYIEKGTYIVEGKIYSYDIGSSLRLFVLQMIFYITICITTFISFKGKNPSINVNAKVGNKEGIILIIMFFIIGILLFNVLISGNAIFDKNINRFNFWSSYSKIKGIFPLQIIQYELQLINGIIFTLSKKKRYKRYCILLYILTLLYYLFIGNLFTQILYITFFFGLPILIVKIQGKEIKFKHLILIPIIILGFVSFKLNYFKNNPQTYYGITDGSLDSLLYRALALQGHTWWGTDRMVQYGVIKPGKQIQNEIAAIKNPEDYQYDAGIWYLMKQVSPYDVYNSYILGNGTFNSGYPAINIALLGYIGAGIFQIINGFLYTKIAVFIYKNLFLRSYIRIFIGSLVYYFFYEYFFMGNLSLFGNMIPKMSILFLIFILIFDKFLPKIKFVIKSKDVII